jgi:DNA-binding response OmpR family regulator
MILVVEDDVTIGRTLAQGLTAAGFAARWLRRGGDVLPLVQEGGVDAVVLDLGLPDGDGLDVCRALRDGGHHLPVLMLTARGGLDDRLDGFAAGADDYLAKPLPLPNWWRGCG